MKGTKSSLQLTELTQFTCVIVKLMVLMGTVVLSTSGLVRTGAQNNDDITHKVVCQSEELEIRCPNSYALKIHGGTYGRMQPGSIVCPYVGSENDFYYNCGEYDVTDKLVNICRRKKKCRFTVSKVLFGDPCKGHAYLTIIYSCVKKIRGKHRLKIRTPKTTTTTPRTTTTTTAPRTTPKMTTTTPRTTTTTTASRTTPKTAPRTTAPRTTTTSTAPRITSRTTLKTTALRTIPQTTTTTTAPAIVKKIRKKPRNKTTTTQPFTNSTINITTTVPIPTQFLITNHTNTTTNVTVLPNIPLRAVTRRKSSPGILISIIVWFLYVKGNSQSFMTVFLISIAAAFVFMLVIVCGICLHKRIRRRKRDTNSQKNSEAELQKLNTNTATYSEVKKKNDLDTLSNSFPAPPSALPPPPDDMIYPSPTPEMINASRPPPPPPPKGSSLDDISKIGQDTKRHISVGRSVSLRSRPPDYKELNFDKLPNVDVGRTDVKAVIIQRNHSSTMYMNPMYENGHMKEVAC